MEEEYNQLCK